MNDPDQLEERVRHKQARAVELKLPYRLHRLYRNWLRHYPAWQQNYPSLCDPRIEDLLEPRPGAIEFTFHSQRFQFLWEQSGKLSVFRNSELVFEASYLIEYDEGKQSEIVIDPGPEWVHAFVDGPWAAELGQLYKEVDDHYKRESQLLEEFRRCDPVRLDELRKRFGID